MFKYMIMKGTYCQKTVKGWKCSVKLKCTIITILSSLYVCMVIKLLYNNIY
jgi:hypothetical protein